MAERKIDLTVIRWYERADAAPDVAARWLAAAEEHFPEAMPRRFGAFEPLRGRLDRDGADGFRTQFTATEGLFFLAGSGPVHHASLAGARPRFVGPTAAHSLSAELPPDDGRLRAFALALTHPATIYVSASVSRGSVLDGDTVYGPAEHREEPYLAPLGDWLGLPPAPPSWCWFGPGYARAVRREPLWTGGPWVDEKFHARLDEADPARRAAPKMPRGLRRSPIKVIFGALRQ